VCANNIQTIVTATPCPCSFIDENDISHLDSHSKRTPSSTAHTMVVVVIVTLTLTASFISPLLLRRMLAIRTVSLSIVINIVITIDCKGIAKFLALPKSLLGLSK
jgi:hypothetical protein